MSKTVNTPYNHVSVSFYEEDYYLDGVEEYDFDYEGHQQEELYNNPENHSCEMCESFEPKFITVGKDVFVGCNNKQARSENKSEQCKCSHYKYNYDYQSIWKDISIYDATKEIKENGGYDHYE